MPWPTCEEGYQRRKLTLFASQVVSDFKNIPLPPGGGPRKVVELTEDSTEILLDDLDLASWRHCQIYFLGVNGGYAWAKTYFNGDLNEDHYRFQFLAVNGTHAYPFDDEALGIKSMGPPPGPWYSQWIFQLLFSGGRARMWFCGENMDPWDPWLQQGVLTYTEEVDNITSITFSTGDPWNPYKAGTRVEVW